MPDYRDSQPKTSQLSSAVHHPTPMYYDVPTSVELAVKMWFVFLVIPMVSWMSKPSISPSKPPRPLETTLSSASPLPELQLKELLIPLMKSELYLLNTMSGCTLMLQLEEKSYSPPNSVTLCLVLN